MTFCSTLNISISVQGFENGCKAFTTLATRICELKGNSRENREGEKSSKMSRIIGVSDGGSAATSQEVPSESGLFNQELVQILPSHAKAEDMPGYSSGAIISMRLINFQVASDSTFNFGPFLNLIIGTNGTGKSTIINAIYLLFRGSLEAIDRRRYDEFIQHGRPHAVVSALLKGKPGGSNPVVAFKVARGRSDLGRSASRPQWFVNGLPCPEEEVDRFIAAFHIQVNNLCQFLPQFRVAAFSGESARQRLISTEKAIGYDGMAEEHESMSSASQELSTLAPEIERLRVQKNALEDKRALLGAKLAQLESANQDKRDMEVLNHVLKIAKYKESQAEETYLETKLKIAREQLLEVDSEDVDTRARVYEAEAHCRRIEEKIQSAVIKYTQNKIQHDSFMTSIASSHCLVQDSISRIKSLKLEIDTANNNLERLQKEIGNAKLSVTELEKELKESGRDTESYNELKSRLETLQNEYMFLEDLNRSVSDARSTKERQAATLQSQIRFHKQKLENLNSNKNKIRSPKQVREILKGDNGNLERSVAFVESMQHRFKKPVIMPALLSLNIADPDILLIIAEQLQSVHLLKFICQTTEDQRLLTKVAAERELDIKVTFVAAESDEKRKQDDQYLQKMKNLGFVGVISEYMDGPEPVLRLMKSLGVNRVAYRRGVIPTQEREKIKKSMSTSRMEFADSHSLYTVSRSRYGSRLQTETIKALPAEPPKWVKFMLRNENSSEIADTQALIENLEAQENHMLNEIKQAMQKEAELQPQLADKIMTLKATKAQLGGEEQLRQRLDRSKRHAQNTAEKIGQSRSFHERHLVQLKALTKDLKRNLGGYLDALSAVPGSLLKDLQLFKYSRAILETQVEDTRNEAKFLSKAIKEKRMPYEAAITELQKELETARSLQKQIEGDHNASMLWLRSQKDPKVGLRKAQSLSVLQIEEEMRRLSATVNLHAQKTDSLINVKHQLEVIEKDCERISDQLTQKESRMEELSRGTESTRRHWETELNLMIARVSAKFSELFSNLGCRGSVTLDKPDSVAVGTWGVDINLAFRHEEKSLSKLTKFRQSGGERAVATAVYLLALQDMATAPFRVLDEINQGMDEKNERTTMKFFVQMACEPNRVTGAAQQTFLVTPKLISELPVHRNLSVTFIYGGPTLGNTDKLAATSRSDSVIQLLRSERQQVEHV